MHGNRKLGFGVLSTWLLAASAGMAFAAELRIEVSDGAVPVADAVVALNRVGGVPSSSTQLATMGQFQSAFVPGVLPIQVGTRVTFPNSDRVRHQVYSFSSVKSFELPLYAGTPVTPVLFDRPGVVVVGCNIHDWMIGHIVVLDTPYFGKTDSSGRAAVLAPLGEYQVTVWHARQAGEVLSRTITLTDAVAASQTFALALTAPTPARQGNDRLRDLQEKFRKRKPTQ